MKQSIKINRTKRGVSLIELMTIMGIISIMTAITIVSLTEGKQKEKLDSVSRELVTHIRELQNNALTGRQQEGVKVCSYGMSAISTGGTSYTTTYYFVESYEDCVRDADSVRSANLVTYHLPEGVEFLGSAESFLYKLPHAARNSKTPRVIQFGIDGREYHVCVNSEGEVQEKFTVSCDE